MKHFIVSEDYKGDLERVFLNRLKKFGTDDPKVFIGNSVKNIILVKDSLSIDNMIRLSESIIPGTIKRDKSLKISYYDDLVNENKDIVKMQEIGKICAGLLIEVSHLDIFKMIETIIETYKNTIDSEERDEYHYYFSPDVQHVPSNKPEYQLLNLKKVPEFTKKPKDTLTNKRNQNRRQPQHFKNTYKIQSTN